MEMNQEYSKFFYMVSRSNERHILTFLKHKMKMQFFVWGNICPKIWKHYKSLTSHTPEVFWRKKELYHMHWKCARMVGERADILYLCFQTGWVGEMITNCTPYVDNREDWFEAHILTKHEQVNTGHSPPYTHMSSVMKQKHRVLLHKCVHVCVPWRYTKVWKVVWLIFHGCLSTIYMYMFLWIEGLEDKPTGRNSVHGVLQSFTYL